MTAESTNAATITTTGRRIIWVLPVVTSLLSIGTVYFALQTAFRIPTNGHALATHNVVGATMSALLIAGGLLGVLLAAAKMCDRTSHTTTGGFIALGLTVSGLAGGVAAQTLTVDKAVAACQISIVLAVTLISIAAAYGYERQGARTTG